MAEIQGLGVTHYPGLMMLDADMSGILRRTLQSEKIPHTLRDPKNWPAPMQAEWGDLKLTEMEAAGQHEVLNWICLAGAMAELGRAARIIDYVESWVFNSNKCFAVFAP